MNNRIIILLLLLLVQIRTQTLKMEDVEDALTTILNAFKLNDSIPFNINLLTLGINVYSKLEKMPEHRNPNFFLTNVSQKCLTAGMKLLPPLKSLPPSGEKGATLLKEPLLRMIDSWGKLPTRMLLGNIQWRGAYDECSKVDVAKYCITPVIISNQTFITGSYGTCVPRECNSADVASVLSFMNDYTTFFSFAESSTLTLCDDPVEYPVGTIIAIVVMCVLLLFCFIGTLFEMIFECWDSSTNSKSPTAGKDNKGLEHNIYTTSVNQANMRDIHDDIGPYEITTAHAPLINVMEAGTSVTIPPITVTEKKVENNTLVCFFTCFSVLKNTRTILSTNIADGAITSVNGIRVISLTWVILGHVYIFGYISTNMPDNIVGVVGIIHRFSFLAVANAYVSVDSFFLLSGLLLAYLTLKRIDNKGLGCIDVIMMYVHRYIRLTPSLALVILFQTYIYPFLVTGPLGVVSSHTTTMRKNCFDYWWSTLLYINNFYPESSDNICLTWTWYLANDMQFYIVAPAIILLMIFIEKKFPTRGVLYNFFAILSMCILSMIITGVIVGAFDLPALLTASFLLGNPQPEQVTMIVDKIYDKPYCRIPPYLVGIFLGYMLSRKITVSGNRGTKMIACGGWMAAITVGLLIIYGPYHAYKEHGTIFTITENIIYAACHKFAWGCAVAWVIYACHNKLGGLVNMFLSWKAWIPLSRLTYGAYLVHAIVIDLHARSKETPNHYQDISAVFDFLSIAFISYICSFILAICLEYPVSNLEKMIFKGR